MKINENMKASDSCKIQVAKFAQAKKGLIRRTTAYIFRNGIANCLID
jgi:hypothetical protein